MDIFEEIVKLKNEGIPAALVTIIKTKGSTPREVGAKMIIAGDGTARGTIGGGCVEGQVWDEAKEVIKNGKVKILEFDLLDDALEGEGQACGGWMQVLIEPVAVPDTAVVLGAGHISLNLGILLNMLGFRLVIADDRDEYASAERFPEADEIIVSEFENLFEKLKITDNTYIVIVTRGHKYDRMMLEKSLRTNACYVGMIGSRAKLKALFDSMKSQGFDDKDIKRVHSPIGIPIHSETPEEIAVSIAAEIIKFKKELHGKSKG